MGIADITAGGRLVQMLDEGLARIRRWVLSSICEHSFSSGAGVFGVRWR